MSEPPGFVPKPMPDGRSLLFDLPRELRDEIYDQALKDAINLLILSPNDVRVITNSGLIGTNKQIRKEVAERFTISACKIHADVYDFDFDHAMAFLNEQPKTPARKITIRLFVEGRFTDWNGGSMNAVKDRLSDWNMRLTAWTKFLVAAPEVEVEYWANFACVPVDLSALLAGRIAVDDLMDYMRGYQEDQEERFREISHALSRGFFAGGHRIYGIF